MAIVSDKPQTTRKRILGIARRPARDRARRHAWNSPARHRNAAMVRDASRPFDGGPGTARRGRGGGGERAPRDRDGRPGRNSAILALNKIDDLVAKEKLLPVIADYATRHAFLEIVPISAKTGDGVERLAELLVRNCRSGGPLIPTTFSRRRPKRSGRRGRPREAPRTDPAGAAIRVDGSGRKMNRDEERDVTVIFASIVVEREGRRRSSSAAADR